MTRQRSLRAESKNCEILLFPTTDRRLTGNAPPGGPHLGQIPHCTESNARRLPGGMGGFGIDWYIKAHNLCPGEISRRSFISAVKSTVHTNPSRRKWIKLSKTLFKRRNLKTLGLSGHSQWRGTVMKLNKVLCCVFLFSFLALTTEHNGCLILTEELTNRNLFITEFMHSV